MKTDSKIPYLFNVTVKMPSVKILIANLKEQIVHIQETIIYLESQLPAEEVEVKNVDKVVEKPKKETKKVEDKVVDKPKKETKKKAEEPVKEAVKETVKEPVKDTKEKKKLNIPRMTDKIQQVLVKTLKTLANMDSDDKVVEKFKKYINQDMTAEEYESDSLENHVTNFVKANYVKTTGGVVSPFIGYEMPPSSQCDDSTHPSIHALQRSITQKQFDSMKKSLVSLGDNNYWSKTEGMWILVETDDDEDLHEIEFEDVKYGVFKSNKRVYQLDEVTDKDIFVGFVGIGKFKNMTI
jgi:hypothetical protein